MAHHAVGDEISSAGGDVVHRQLDAKRLYSDDTKTCVALQRPPVDDPLPGDAGIDAVKEPEPLGQPSQEPHVGDVAALQGEGEPESSEAGADLLENGKVAVGDAEDTVAAGSLGVEDAREKALAPLVGGEGGIPDHRPDSVDTGP